MKAGTKELQNFLERNVPRDGETRPLWFSRVALKTGLSTSRVKSIFYDPCCKVDAEEWIKLQKLEPKQAAVGHRQAIENLMVKSREIQDELERIYSELDDQKRVTDYKPCPHRYRYAPSSSLNRGSMA